MLEVMPIGVIAFPGSGITENLVDKARARRIPVRRYGADTCHRPAAATLGGPARAGSPLSLLNRSRIGRATSASPAAVPLSPRPPPPAPFPPDPHRPRPGKRE